MDGPMLLIQRVKIGSAEHLIPIFIAVILAVFFIRYAKRRLFKTHQQNAFNALGIFVSLTVAAYHLYYISLGDYDLKTDLPLHLCSLIALLIPIFTHFRSFWMYEILLFWIVAGTLQGVVTPDISEGFPAFDYFRYWVVHLGLLTIIFYATFVFDMRPKFKSIFKSFLALQVYVVLMVLVNYLFDANYFYLNEKPKSTSILDYLGEWPLYIIVGQLILIPYFLIIYLPFHLTKKKSAISQTVD